MLDVASAPEGVNLPAGVQELIDAEVAGRERIAVLEAGCGSATQLDFGRGAEITGIDISARQLERNALLAHRIHGDLQTHRLPPAAFDIVVCWNVLEHLDRPRAALQNMVDAVRPGGLLVIAIPNAHSVKGWVTRLTPHRFHVWVYRRLFGFAAAAVDDAGPFRTRFAAPATPAGLHAFASEQGLSVERWLWGEDYAQRLLRRRLRLDGRAAGHVTRAVRRISRGRVEIDRTDLFVVLRATTIASKALAEPELEREQAPNGPGEAGGAGS